MTLKEKAIAWFRLTRLPLYSLAFIAYSMGAAAAHATYQQFDGAVYALGGLGLILIMLNAVILNEYVDYPSDCLNKNRGAFNAGSGVLVEGKLGFSEVKAGFVLILCAIPVCAYVLIQLATEVSATSVLALVFIGIFFGWGYSAPPLKFSYRGLGELVNSLMHGPAIVLAGFVLQTGMWTSSLPWLLGTPLFFATLAAAILADLPDYRSDAEISRKTVPVIIGPRLTALLASGFIALAVIAGLALWYVELIKYPLGLLILIVVPNAVIQERAVITMIKKADYDRHMTDIMKYADLQMLLFGLLPLLAFLLR
ncbi:MAG TPA: prenyltransferase [Methanomicrobia archaeon]|nr:prenyltransferase [Methanomicrobia archaeon]